MVDELKTVKVSDRQEFKRVYCWSFKVLKRIPYSWNLKEFINSQDLKFKKINNCLSTCAPNVISHFASVVLIAVNHTNNLMLMSKRNCIISVT